MPANTVKHKKLRQNDLVALKDRFAALKNGFIALQNDLLPLKQGFVALRMGFIVPHEGFEAAIFSYAALQTSKKASNTIHLTLKPSNYA